MTAGKYVRMVGWPGTDVPGFGGPAAECEENLCGAGR